MSRTIASLVALVAMLGCKVYDPALVDRDAGPIEGCDPLAKPPPRPAGPDDGDDIGEIAYAMRDVLFEQDGDRWRTLGYDLDDRCSVVTPDGPPPSVECVPPAPGASPEVDGARGIDNAFGHQLFPLVAVVVPGLQDASRAFQEKGNGSVLVRITGYNGRADDSRVHVVAAVTVFGTPGMADGSAPDVTITAEGPRTSSGEIPPDPAWRGNDYFWARDDNFVDGEESRPIVVDDNAYVAGNVLVINLPERTNFVFPGEDVGLEARLTDAVATGRISADRSLLEDVVVAGRWSVLDLLTTAASVGVCPDSTEAMIFQNQLDRIVDVRANAGTGGPGVPCDAISVGIGFDGYAAKFGGIAPGPPIADACMGGPGLPDGSIVVPDGGLPDGG